MKTPTQDSKTGNPQALRGGARVLTVVLAATLLNVFSAGCGDNGGGGGMVTNPCIEFSASVIAQPGAVVALNGAGSGCNLMVVEVMVTQVDDLFGASFVVRYPSDLASFSTASSLGSILASDGAAVDVIAAETVAGEVTVGLARLATTGVDVGAPSLLARLSFFRVATEEGNGSLGFTNAALLDASDPPQQIPGIVWTGGTVRVTVN
jgi:hypothetical protein